MNCETIKNLFPDYLMMEADEAAISQVEIHIAECPVCREELGTASEMWSKLEVLPAEFPGEGLRERFYHMLQNEIASGTGQQEKRGKAFTDRVLSFVLQRRLLSPAAVILLVLSGFTAGLFISTRTGVSDSRPEIPSGTSMNAVRAGNSGNLSAVQLIDALHKLRSGEFPAADRDVPGRTANDSSNKERSFFQFYTQAAFRFVDYFDRFFRL